VEIVAVISGRDIYQYEDETSYDYLISTVNLSKFSPDCYIKVNPIFSAEDYAHLEGFLKTRLAPVLENSRQIELAKKLAVIAKKYGADGESLQMQYDFLVLLMNESKFGSPISRQVEPFNLNDLMPPSLMRFKVPCRDWRHVIKEGAQLLEQNHYVEPRYKEAVIKNIEDFGPNMLMFPGVVISHAKPSDGCKKVGFSFMSLLRPIWFGNQYFDPAKIVITLSVLNNDLHLNALTQLFRLLSEEEDRMKFQKANIKEEVIKLIGKYSD